MRPDLRVMAEYCAASKLDLVRQCDWHTYNSSKGFLAMKRTPGARILAVAHMDYIGSGKVSFVSRKHIISSALDDRAGVYIIMNLLPKLGIEADILLTDNEERGDSTIRDLGIDMISQYNWIVQFDRRGEGAVHYGYTDMIPHLKKHFAFVDRGSMTCISAIESCSPVGAFNCAVGYVGEHAETCNLSARVLNRQMMRFRAFYEEYKDTRLDHVGSNLGEQTHNARYKYTNKSSYVGGMGSFGNRGGWGDDSNDYEDWTEGTYINTPKKLMPIGATKPPSLFMVQTKPCIFCKDPVPPNADGFSVGLNEVTICDDCVYVIEDDMSNTEHPDLTMHEATWVYADTIWFNDDEAAMYREFLVAHGKWGRAIKVAKDEVT